MRGSDAGTGAPAVVVAERTMSWVFDDQRETHSAGTSTPAAMLDLADGNQGAFDTYGSIFNPTRRRRRAGVVPARERIHLRRGLRVGSAGLDDSHAARVATAIAPFNERGPSRARAGRY